MVVKWCPLKSLVKCAGLPKHLNVRSSSLVGQEHDDAISTVDFLFFYFFFSQAEFKQACSTLPSVLWLSLVEPGCTVTGCSGP